MKPKRKLKVRRAFSEEVRPSVLLSGKWLEKAGFRIGQTVEVSVRQRRLVIIPATTEEIDCPLQQDE